MTNFIFNIRPLPKNVKYKITTICEETSSEVDVYGLDSRLTCLVEDHYNTSLERLIKFNDAKLVDYRSFCNLHDIPLTEGVSQAIIEKRHILDDLSYPVHTNRELRLMRYGKKPLAVFSHHLSEDVSLADLTSDQNFKAFGFEKTEWIYNNVAYFFYSLDCEQWRLSAYQVMVCSRVATGHSRQLEWMEGLLLGYTPEQNHEFLEKFFPS